jgi:hypothetical protein
MQPQNLNNMKFLISFQLSILLFVNLSCSHVPVSGEEKYPVGIKVNVSELKHDSLNLSEIADKIEYIPLETSDSLLIDGFPSVDISGGFYFVQFGRYRFDSNGKFLNYVYSEGHGPGEIIPSLVAANESDSALYVYGIDGAVDVYTFSGEFKYKLNKSLAPVGLPPDMINFFYKYLLIGNRQLPVVKNIYSCYDFRKDSLIVLCGNYRKYRDAQLIKWPSIVPWEHRWQIEDSCLLYKENFSDTIFSVDTSLNKSAKYIIDLDGDKLEWETWRDTRMFIVSDNPPAGYGVLSFFETKSLLIFTITSFTDPGILVIYNKESKSAKLYPCNGDRNIHTQWMQQVYLRNDLDGIIPVPFTTRDFYNYKDGYFYVTINAMDFQQAWSAASEKTKTSSEYLRKMYSVLSRINENSNPVIMKIHMR